MIARFTSALFAALVFLPVSAGTVCGQDAGVSEVLISSSNKASVAAVFAGNTADFVVIDAGYDCDFCTGARCRVDREDVPVAEIIIAEANNQRSVALITYLENNQTIKTGDTVKLKTI